MKWQFLIFYRNNLVFMIFGITFFYGVALYFLRDLGEIERLTTLVIFNEPTLVGFMFTGLAVILEKDQGVILPLFVTPVNLHLYLLARILTLSIISLVCSLSLVIIVKGSAFDPFLFSFGALTACLFFSLVGIYVVSFTTDILHYLLRSIPIIVLMSLPFLNYFDLTELSLLNYLPVAGSLALVTASYSVDGAMYAAIKGVILVVVWMPILYLIAFTTFKRRMVSS